MRCDAVLGFAKREQNAAAQAVNPEPIRIMPNPAGEIFRPFELCQRLVITVKNAQAFHEIEANLQLPSRVGKLFAVPQGGQVVGGGLGMGPQESGMVSGLAPITGRFSLPACAGQMPSQVFGRHLCVPGQDIIRNLPVNPASHAA